MRFAAPSAVHPRLKWRTVLCAVGIAALPACQAKADKPDDSTVVPTPAPASSGDNGVANPGGVTEFGYGPLRAGMTYQAANDSLKGALKAAKGANLAECDYVKWEGGPVGLNVMVLEGKIARVDVGDSSTIATDAGARVGDTEKRIKTLYGARVVVTDHKYDDGHYLTVRSANAADTLHFIIFETSKGKVTRFRAGAMPGIQYVEGCS